MGQVIWLAWSASACADTGPITDTFISCLSHFVTICMWCTWRNSGWLKMTINLQRHHAAFSEISTTNTKLLRNVSKCKNYSEMDIRRRPISFQPADFLEMSELSGNVMIAGHWRALTWNSADVGSGLQECFDSRSWSLCGTPEIYHFKYSCVWLVAMWTYEKKPHTMQHIWWQTWNGT